jgi:hypothetical protein
LTGLLFDKPSPSKPQTKVSKPEPPKETPPPQFGPDVVRVIEQKYGTFRRVSREGILDEYRILELRNGALVEETTGGLRRQTSVTRELLQSSLKDGFWRVVGGAS